MFEWKEEALRYKYAPIPEEAPRHVKKRGKKVPKKANHRHEYENCIIVGYSQLCSVPKDALASYCTICGKRGDYHQDELSRKYGYTGYLDFIVACGGKTAERAEFMHEARSTYRTFHTNGKIMDVTNVFDID